MTTIPSALSPPRASESSVRPLEAACTWTSLVLLALAVFGLVSAWIAGFRGGPFLGMTEFHSFNSAIVLALLAIACRLHGITQRVTG